MGLFSFTEEEQRGWEARNAQASIECPDMSPVGLASRQVREAEKDLEEALSAVSTARAHLAAAQRRLEVEEARAAARARGEVKVDGGWQPLVALRGIFAVNRDCEGEFLGYQTVPQPLPGWITNLADRARDVAAALAAPQPPTWGDELDRKVQYVYFQ